MIKKVFIVLIFLYLFVGCKSPTLMQECLTDDNYLSMLFGNYSSTIEPIRYRVYVCSLIQVRKFVDNIGEIHTINISDSASSSSNHPFRGSTFRIYFIHDTKNKKAVLWSTKLNSDDEFIRINKPLYGTYESVEFIATNELEFDSKKKKFKHRKIKNLIYIEFDDQVYHEDYLIIKSTSFESHKLSGEKRFVFFPSDIYGSSCFLKFNLLK